jgi:hypothetical protein
MLIGQEFCIEDIKCDSRTLGCLRGKSCMLDADRDPASMSSSSGVAKDLVSYMMTHKSRKSGLTNEIC